MNKNFYHLITLIILGVALANTPVLAASSLDNSTNYQLTILTETISTPNSLSFASPLYEIRNNNLQTGRTFFLNLDYQALDESDKTVFYFDKTKGLWRELPSTDQRELKQVKVEIPFSYVRLAVFSHQKVATEPVVMKLEVATTTTKVIDAIAETEEVVVRGVSRKVLTDKISSPWNYQSISPLFEIKNDTLEKGGTFYLDLPYQESNPYLKIAMYFDKNKNTWQALPTVDNPQNKTIRVTIPFSYVRIAVFANENILSVGQASWYNYKGGLFAASPDFAKGSSLRVFNLANNKYVDVVINDYGPDRRLHSDRVLDLDKKAFAKIASTGEGIINVRIEVIKSSALKLEAGLKAASEPSVSAASAVIMDEKTGSILWSKNGENVLPLASLTKLVAAKVFLDTKPDLNKVVSYQKQDEDYNYEYCKPGESARLKVNNGETMKIQDFLYSALVGSANNAVESLVRVSGLSRAQFIAKMNEDVSVWGAKSTHFEEPTGLSPNNVSSPYDYAIISKEVLSNPLLAKISVTSKYVFSTIDTKIKHTIVNTNKLLTYNKLNINGSKTGYLDEAGYCLMTRSKTQNGSLIVVNFNSKSKEANFADNEKLIIFGTQLLKK